MACGADAHVLVYPGHASQPTRDHRCGTPGQGVPPTVLREAQGLRDPHGVFGHPLGGRWMAGTTGGG